MDVKCVRVLRPYGPEVSTKGPADKGLVLYVDESARYSLNKNWGDSVEAKGRRTVMVVIQPLAEMDQDGFIARAGQKVIDALYIEYGEEILLH